MKKHLLISLSIIVSSVSFSQNLTKEEKTAFREFTTRMETPTMKVLGDFGPGMRRDTLYTNNAVPAEYLGFAEDYNSKVKELEKYFISGLYPLFLAGKIPDLFKNQVVFFPDGYVYADATYQLHMQGKLALTQEWEIKSFHEFSTEDGNAILVELFNSKIQMYDYGMIKEDRLKTLMSKVEQKEIGIITDERDGAYYKWTKIGEQIWMAENLKYTLPEHADMDKSIGFSAYRGRYYNYPQAMTSCPKGWHLPSDAEWQEMELIAGVWPMDLNVEGNFSRVGIDTLPGFELMFGSRLMFNAHLAGSVSKHQFSQGRYDQNDVGSRAFFWTSTKSDEVNAKFRMLGKDFDGIVRDNIGTQGYLNCRCVQDEDISIMLAKHPKLKEITDKITADPSDAGNYFDRSIEFLLLGEGNRALDDINKAIELDPDNPEQKLFKAQIFYLYSFDVNADETRKLVEDYTASVTDNAFAYYFQSKLILYDAEVGALNATKDEERRNEALKNINKALKLDPKNPQFLNYKAKLLVVMGEYSKAVTALNKAIESDPNNGDMYFLLGKMMLKKYDGLNKANGTSSQRWCTSMTGMCFKLTTKQLEEVCATFVKAVELGDNVSPDYLGMCNELEQAKTLKKHAPIVYTGPRGGRYTISSGGNKVYLPRR
jgi:uncharacterized protein (TIGR02145 family)